MIKRAVEGAIAGGMPVGRVEVVGTRILIYGLEAARGDSEAADVEERMRRAFDG